jgi:hypothetical protein
LADAGGLLVCPGGGVVRSGTWFLLVLLFDRVCGAVSGASAEGRVPGPCSLASTPPPRFAVSVAVGCGDGLAGQPNCLVAWAAVPGLGQAGWGRESRLAGARLAVVPMSIRAGWPPRIGTRARVVRCGRVRSARPHRGPVRRAAVRCLVPDPVPAVGVVVVVGVGPWWVGPESVGRGGVAADRPRRRSRRRGGRRGRGREGRGGSVRRGCGRRARVG